MEYWRPTGRQKSTAVSVCHDRRLWSSCSRPRGNVTAGEAPGLVMVEPPARLCGHAIGSRRSGALWNEALEEVVDPLEDEARGFRATSMRQRDRLASPAENPRWGVSPSYVGRAACPWLPRSSARTVPSKYRRQASRRRPPSGSRERHVSTARSRSSSSGLPSSTPARSPSSQPRSSTPAHWRSSQPRKPRAKQRRHHDHAMCSWMSMTIEQVLDLNNRAVFFINEARYLLAIPPLVRCARRTPTPSPSG